MTATMRRAVEADVEPLLDLSVRVLRAGLKGARYVLSKRRRGQVCAAFDGGQQAGHA